MKRFNWLIPSFLLAISFLVACGPQDASQEQTQEEETREDYVAIEDMSPQELLAYIEKQEAELYGDSVKIEPYKAAELMKSLATFAERFPDDSRTPEYLFKAGEIAMGLNHSVESVRYLTTLYDTYKAYEKRPYALFLKAFVLENQLQQYDEAKVYYQEFIDNYPDHSMVEDAQYSIKNMGKSPEELIKEFEQNQASS